MRSRTASTRSASRSYRRSSDRFITLSCVLATAPWCGGGAPASSDAELKSSSTRGLMPAARAAVYIEAMDLRAAVRRLGRLSPWVVDAGLAAGLAVIALTEIAVDTRCACLATSDVWWSAAFTIGITLPLVLRRRYPFAVMNAVGITAAVYNIINIPPDPYTLTFAILVAVYSVAAYARQPLAVTAAVISLVAL